MYIVLTPTQNIYIYTCKSRMGLGTSFKLFLIPLPISAYTPVSVDTLASVPIRRGQKSPMGGATQRKQVAKQKIRPLFLSCLTIMLLGIPDTIIMLYISSASHSRDPCIYGHGNFHIALHSRYYSLIQCFIVVIGLIITDITIIGQPQNAILVSLCTRTQHALFLQDVQYNTEIAEKVGIT